MIKKEPEVEVVTSDDMSISEETMLVVGDDTAREIFPVVWLDEEEHEDSLYDFRPIERDNEELPAPKASSAPEPVSSSESVTETEESPEPPAKLVPVEKANGQPKESESSTPTS